MGGIVRAGAAVRFCVAQRRHGGGTEPGGPARPDADRQPEPDGGRAAGRRRFRTDGWRVAAFRYFKAEQEAGTPFTHDGANAIRTLGIRTIVLLLAAAVFSTLTYEFFGLATAMVVDWDNLVSVSLGLVMILASLIFRYGAELEGEAVTQG